MNNAFGKIEKFVYPSQRAKRHDAPQDYNYGHTGRVSKGKENWEEKQELFGLASFFDSIHLLDHQSIFLSLEWHGLLLHLLQKSCAVAKVLPSCLQSFPLVIFTDGLLAKWLLAVLFHRQLWLFMMKTSCQSSHSFSHSQVSNAIQGGYLFSFLTKKTIYATCICHCLKLPHTFSAQKNNVSVLSLRIFARKLGSLFLTS